LRSTGDGVDDNNQVTVDFNLEIEVSHLF
jgi:hypothetical protein